jgi:sugar/nucleoside kinase (ribokinase family)
MFPHPLVRFLFAGKLQRDFIITSQHKALIDVPGGDLLYSAVGFGIWDNGAGLIGRVGEDYPHEWLDKLCKYGFDCRGVDIVPEVIDTRAFFYYRDHVKYDTESPASHFARLTIPLPKALLGYVPRNKAQADTFQQVLTFHEKDIPEDYLDVTAAHLCPMDFKCQNHLLTLLRRGHINNLTLDAADSYMTSAYLDRIHLLISGLTAFHATEDQMRSLFQGRTNDLWEMAETIASFGSEYVVIKRGSEGQYVYQHYNPKRWRVPAYPVKVGDPLGAGNAFCGGFLAGIRTTYDPLEACLYGNISASFAVEGTRAFYMLDTLPGLAEARKYKLKNMVRKI